MTTTKFKEDQSAIVREMVEWIEANINRPISVEEASARAGYTKWHFQRMFCAIAGIPLGVYIRRRRLTLVAQLLPSSQVSIGHFVAFFGFDSPQVFHRAFTRQFGMTPLSVMSGRKIPDGLMQHKLSIKRGYSAR